MAETPLTNEQKINKALKRAFIGMVIFVVSFISIYVLIIMLCTSAGNWTTRGQFGDMFGFINALFSGLAFAGLIYTAMMQRFELSLQREELITQREELKLNREELIKQSKAQESTEKTLRDQAAQQRQIQAEGTFFNLLNSIRNMVANTEGRIINEVEGTYTNRTENKAKGVNYFSEVSKELSKRMMDKMSPYIIQGVINSKELGQEEVEKAHREARETYNNFFKEHSFQLAHYYRFTFNVLTYVDSNPDIPEPKKIQYVNFLQSQMSDSELLLLYYNGIGQHGKKYYDLIEKYDFLQNMNTSENNGIVELLWGFYPKSSFGNK